MLVVDELHNILSGTQAQQRRLLNLIRWFGNELQIPLTGVGTVEVLRAIQSNDQCTNRFVPCALPLWSDDDDFRRLLNTLEAVLPLRKRSDLEDPGPRQPYICGRRRDFGRNHRHRHPGCGRSRQIGERVHHLAHDRGRQLYSSFGTSARRSLIASLAGCIGRRRGSPQ